MWCRAPTVMDLVASRHRAADRVVDAAGRAPRAVRRAPGLRVLVVDDSEDTADLLALVLAKVGHDVRVAYTGRAALEVADVHVPELALIDLYLPDLDGACVAWALRERGAAPPFLVALDSRPSRAVARPFDVRACKPIDLFVLQQIVAGAKHARRP